ncbi:MAG: aminoacyl-tRNA hydrolase [Bdellovibrionales bacterium]|jgi:peptidyl-tRNA hydrolase, PTH1 family|nr:aminoacyl-tRNA hydrolase [Bdellovibrionales bacterium]
MDKLIVGLGNPGTQYELNRHNIGHLIIDELENSLNLRWKEKFKGVYSSVEVCGDKVYFLKPLTYMNLSGESVAPLVNFFKISIENVLVIHDELDLNMGTIALKDGGGLAGHNGLKSIFEKTGNKNFKRLRVGIGRPKLGSVSSWVLSDFSQDETPHLEKIINESSCAIKSFLENDFSSAFRKYKKFQVN